jgi:putative nucleotidyltransferase with HDIG domain
MRTEISYSGTPLYNSRIVSTYVRFIKTNYSYVNLSDLLAHAGMESYQVEDEDHWFTQEQVDRFHEKLREVTNNDNVARDAGRYAASPDVLGIWRSYILGFAGPARVYEMAGKIGSTMVRSSVFKATRIASDRVEITVTPKPGAQEKSFQCQNRIGHFEAIAMFFNYKLPTIEHTECIFQGGKCCRYVITWREVRSIFWRNLRNYALLPVVGTCLGLYLKVPGPAWAVFLSASLLTLFLLAIYTGRLQRKELTSAIDNLRISTDLLLEKIETNYNNVRLINEIGLTLSRLTDAKAILGEVMQALKKRLDYDRGMILLADKEKRRLEYGAGFGYSKNDLHFLKETTFHLDRPESKGIFVLCFRERRSFLINDVEEIVKDLSPRSLNFARALGAKSFICCPIVHLEDAMGILVVDNVRTKRPLLQRDIDVMMGITPQIGIGIQNARITEAKEKQFHSILRVLASSIDARDPLTAGHSERVTRYAVGIAEELGLSRDYCEMLRVAALLHDYGKIAIRDTILKKQGVLTPKEREEIQTHAAKTREILEKIEFEGIYKEVPDVAEAHHEKYDGTGYPRGLKAEEILLGARILAVADVFEAITSKRHYRDPMLLDDALRLLDQDRGKHFDPDIVDAFMRYLAKTGETFREPLPERKPREAGNLRAWTSDPGPRSLVCK